MSATKAGSSVPSASIAPSASRRPASCRAVPPARDGGGVVDQKPGRQRLQRLPAIERIGVARGEEAQLVGGEIGDELDRRRKSAVEREHRRLVDAAEHEGFGGLGQGQHAALDARPSASASGRSRPSRPTSPIASGITIGSLLGWPGVAGTVCATSRR